MLMWESRLRHEVPPNAAKARRILVSFNYAWSSEGDQGADRTPGGLAVGV